MADMTDAEFVAERMEDRLALIMTMQKEFQEVILGHGDLTALIGTDKGAEYFRTQSLALIFEIGEASNEIGWKPWATTRHINHKAYRAELVDAFHFLLNLMLLDDMTADELYDGYIEKQQINRDRQANGYTGTAKCPACAGAYDDPAVLCRPAEPGWRDSSKACTTCAVDGIRQTQSMCREHGDPEARGPWCQKMYPRPLQVKEGECPNCRAKYGEPGVTCVPVDPWIVRQEKPSVVGWCNTSKSEVHRQ